MGAIRKLIFFFFLFASSLSFVEAKSASSSNRTQAVRNIMNFVWKDLSLCNLDSMIQILLYQDGVTFSQLKDFWEKSTLCNPALASKLKDKYEMAAYSLKMHLINELKRAMKKVESKKPSQLREMIHNTAFQRHVIGLTQSAYNRILKEKPSTFVGYISEDEIVAYIDQHDSSISKNRMLRIAEFNVHRSAGGHTPDGNKWMSAAYGSVVKLGSSNIGLVNRVTWGFEGDPRFEPGHASDSIHGTFECGFATLGSDKIGIELLGIQAVSNNGRPEQLVSLSINWTPLADEDLEISLSAWMEVFQHQPQGSGDPEEEAPEKEPANWFVSLSASYSISGINMFEPIVNFVKRKRAMRQMLSASDSLKELEATPQKANTNQKASSSVVVQKSNTTAVKAEAKPTKKWYQFWKNFKPYTKN